LRPGFGVRVAVQPDEHGRILRDRDEQVAEVAKRATAEQLDLALLLLRIF
jgi:hypothetical protein